MTSRQTLTIPIKPWYKDHYFNNRVILPAVEIIVILAQLTHEIAPDISLQNIRDASFAKFLEIPDGCRELELFTEHEELNEQTLRIRLLSKIQLKTMSRMKLHAEMTFGSPVHAAADTSNGKPKKRGSVSAKQIYRELVPFGSAYQSLTGTLQLTETTARGTLLAPDLPETQSVQHLLGSPFPLDGAMHAACVLGQCSMNMIPFPVGFEQRTIHQATRSGKTYSTEVRLVSKTAEELLCDLILRDTDGGLCEQIQNLRMRDVSGGQIRPPEWIQNLLQ